MFLIIHYLMERSMMQIRREQFPQILAGKKMSDNLVTTKQCSFVLVQMVQFGVITGITILL